MVNVGYWHHTAYGSSRSAWSEGWQPTGTLLHSLHEPGELSQCFKHDSIITIILVLLLLLLKSSK